MDNDTKQAIAICVTILCCFGFLVAGPVSCVIQSEKLTTERTKIACEGDLKADSARAVACVAAVNRRLW